MNIDLNLPPPTKCHLSETERLIIFTTIPENSTNGRPKRGVITRLVDSFKVNRTTVWRIWQRGKSSISNSTDEQNMSVVPKVAIRMKGVVGRKRKNCDLSRIPEIDLRSRTNIRSLSAALSIPKSIVHRHIAEGNIRAHSNALHPDLSEAHKKRRLEFFLSMLDRNTIGANPTFYDMFDSIHIDEKWFYMSKETEKYYLLSEEVDPIRTCKSKCFIEKVMFLAVVCRPQFDTYRNCMFDGKIGIFPFIKEEPARRNSKNRSIRAIVTNPITSITKEVYRSCLIEKVFPAIRRCWPRSEGVTRILIQQDNALAHIAIFDPEFVECASIEGFDIHMTFQPPNSRDLNVLDLGYFRSIQALQHQKAPRTVPELIGAVEKSFEELNAITLDKVFLSLQACMIETIKVFGGNNYKLPHMGKDHQERNGNLPCQLSCDIEIVTQADIHLNQLSVPTSVPTFTL